VQLILTETAGIRKSQIKNQK